jgi:hypothetical protein
MPNESLIHAYIFFFISSIAFVLIAILVIIVLCYTIKILRNAGEISEKIKAESAEFVADLKKLRANLRDEGVKWKHVVDLVRNFFVKKGEKIVKKRVKDAKEN